MKWKKKEKETKAQPVVEINNEKEKIVAWQPTYKWLGTVAAIILASLIVIFFVLNIMLKPYMRQIPPEITPWLFDTWRSK
ncbi:MAG: hypothetical protein FWF00_07540 [Endomicrobia bacterium]|nr:hypothetical protein [Endomicrobiia bacterium]